MSNLVGPWVRRFLVEYVIAERNYSVNTQKSYRDTFLLFLPFAAKRCRCAVDQLGMAKIKPKLIREFVGHLEQDRRCGSSTINLRLATLRAWARFIGANSPEQIEWSSHILTVRLRKTAPGSVGYLEKEEVEALLAVPDRTTAQGLRDHTLLLFLYNTGARVSEVCQLTIGDLDLEKKVALLHGKGRRDRRCPLWKVTVAALQRLVSGHPATQVVFRNNVGRPLTRFGIHTLVERCVRRAAVGTPTLRTKRVSPHIIRHTTGTHLLRSGVDINTIRMWLGHVSLETTHIYAESDLQMKAAALARCEAPLLRAGRSPSRQKGLLDFLTRM